MVESLLESVLAKHPPAFALLHRPEATGPGSIEILVGEVSTPQRLADIRLPDRPKDRGKGRHEVLAVIPYRQITERGFTCVDDGAPLVVMAVTDHTTMPVGEVLPRLPDTPVRLLGGGFDIDDDSYAATVREVMTNEIGQGKGANFVIKRSFLAEVDSYTVGCALTYFRRLMHRESGAYWTFVVHTGAHTFIGATPERHISLRNEVAAMNPISGTYRYPPSGPNLAEVMEFLSDRKEVEELYMVVDEELKMMARICDDSVRVVGPYLKEMAHLAHTEYFVEGRTSRDVREILRETMFAPTVTGSPLESACKVISRYEPQGRGYYSGALALIGQDEHGGRCLDSAILIRTADINDSGQVQLGVGATLVRHSDPVSEVAETRAKAAGMLAALTGSSSGRLGNHPSVRAALARRNENISGFWLTTDRAKPEPALAGRRVLIVDAEDTFTSMLGLQLRSLGLAVTVRRYDEPYTVEGHDLVVMGPGPGDPRQVDDPKIAHLHTTILGLLNARRPFFAVCLSHQVLSILLGFGMVRRPVPNQGVQIEIDLFGYHERVGFYNTFAARSSEDKKERAGVGLVEVSRDAATGEVHALRGPRFASIQFHAESLLTEDGVRIMRTLILEVLGG